MFDIILSSFAYVKGGSLNQGHSHAFEGCFWGGIGREISCADEFSSFAPYYKRGKTVAKPTKTDGSFP